MALSAPTYDLLGVRMSVLNIPDAVRRIVEAAEVGRKGYVCVTGMHGIMEARDDFALQNILNAAFLCTPDGMPTVWFGKAKGHREMDRVYGPDLMLAVMENTRGTAIQHFFYGGAEGVAEDLKQRMEALFPGVRIAGTYCPPFRPLNEAEREELSSKVAASKADILWVGLSTPKQERFMSEFLPILPVKVMLGVGAAFDFHTARALQAPRWMQRAGLEWFFRLATEPKRLGRRYLTQVPRFALLLILDRIGFISHSSERPEMPAAMRMVSAWHGLLLIALGGVLVTTFTGLASTTPGAALILTAWLLVAPTFFVGTTFLLHCAASEARPDRLLPMISLFLFFLTGILSVGGPIAALFSILTGTFTAAISIAQLLALIAAGLCLASLVVLIVVILFTSSERIETSSPRKTTVLPRV